MIECLEVALVAVVPPMELEEVETFDTHSRERDTDRLLDGAPRHPARPRNPFREGLDLRQSLGSVAGGEEAAEIADEVLGRAVMIREIPGCEPGVVIGKHLVDRAHRFDRAMCARDLPHPIEDAA